MQEYNIIPVKYYSKIVVILFSIEINQKTLFENFKSIRRINTFYKI